MEDVKTLNEKEKNTQTHGGESQLCSPGAKHSAELIQHRVELILQLL